MEALEAGAFEVGDRNLVDQVDFSFIRSILHSEAELCALNLDHPWTALVSVRVCGGHA